MDRGNEGGGGLFLCFDCFYVCESLNFLAFYDYDFKDFFIFSLKMQDKVHKELWKIENFP